MNDEYFRLDKKIGNPEEFPIVPSSGIEPETRGFSVHCSTNWANWAYKASALSSGDRIWTYDLRVMSPTSFQTAPPRDIK